MKKQEFIHVHSLLAQVQNHYERETEEAVDMEEYENVGVMPTSIHRSKTDHKEAVFALTECVTSAMEGEEASEAPPVAAD